MKFSFSLLLVTLLAASVVVQGHNATWGARSMRDVHMRREIVAKKSSFLRVVSTDYEFNQKDLPYPRTITQVTVTDQYTNNNGGKAMLVSGGPRSTDVKLHLKSQRGHGFNFIIDIYEHYMERSKSYAGRRSYAIVKFHCGNNREGYGFGVNFYCDHHYSRFFNGTAVTFPPSNLTNAVSLQRLQSCCGRIIRSGKILSVS